MLAFTEPQARADLGLRRLALRFQAILFFPLLLLEAAAAPGSRCCSWKPLLLLEAASLHVASIRALASRGPVTGPGRLGCSPSMRRVTAELPGLIAGLEALPGVLVRRLSVHVAE